MKLVTIHCEVKSSGCSAGTCLCYRTALRFDFLRLWSVRKSLISDTQNPEISGFSIAHAYKYKTKRQEKMNRRHRKFFVD